MIKRYGLVAALVLLLPAAASAQTVRGLNSDVLREAINEGQTHSATFGRIVETIAAQKAVVMVQWGQTPSGTDAALAHVVTVGADGTKFLRVVVRTGKNGDRLVATIGHELQHAVELLNESNIQTVSFNRGGRVWETKEAQNIEKMVLAEMKNR